MGVSKGPDTQAVGGVQLSLQELAAHILQHDTIIAIGITMTEKESEKTKKGERVFTIPGTVQYDT